MVLDVDAVVGVLMALVNIVGALALLVLIYVAWLFSRKSVQKFSPDAMNVKFAKAFSRRWVILAFLVCGINVIFCLVGPVSSPSWDFVAALFVGGALQFLIQGKGFGVPLGLGLKMTVDRAPKLNVSLSKYTMSFHVDKHFREHRAEITSLMIEAINSLNVAGCEYDYVLKSWIFADRKGCDTKLVQQVESCLRYIRLGILSFIPAAVLAALICVVSSVYGLSTNVVGAAFILFVLGLLLAIGMPLMMGLRIRNLTKDLWSGQCAKNQAAAAMRLSKKMIKRTTGLECSFISYRPCPVFNLIAASFRKRPPVNPARLQEQGQLETFIGIEAGFVLVHSKSSKEKSCVCAPAPSEIALARDSGGCRQMPPE
ncbi:hypothetical protein ACNFBR_20520 [Pseudomonas sp. NY11955]|uniref:hypothetical protein n=1 Tax=Pseudomonas sp. NY11955 TaxID=3400363 RepID=UPI003A85FCDD